MVDSIAQHQVQQGIWFAPHRSNHLQEDGRGKINFITVVNRGKLKSEPNHIGNKRPTVASYPEHPDKGMAF